MNDNSKRASRSSTDQPARGGAYKRWNQASMPEPERKGLPEQRDSLTDDYLLDKRAKILLELRSDEHFEATDTVVYGRHDPLDVAPGACDECGSLPELSQQGDEERPRWLAVCTGCGRSPKEPRAWPWLAGLAWNQINLRGMSYGALPLFSLDGLSPSEARERMIGIRHNLELRKNLAGLDRRLVNVLDISPPGTMYQRRLDAYLQWAMLALRLIKTTPR